MAASTTQQLNCPGNSTQCANTAAIMDMKEQIGGIDSKIDAVSKKLDEKLGDYSAKISKLDEIVQIGNGEPALKVSVKALLRAEELRRADALESRKTNWGFVTQLILIVVQVVLAIMLERSLGEVKAGRKATDGATAKSSAATEIVATPLSIMN